jgi:hypothetical protein
MEVSHKGKLKVSPQDCREILQTSDLAAVLKDYGANDADIHYLLEDLAGQMEWRMRLWNGSDPVMQPTKFDQPLCLRLPIDLKKRIETTGKPVESWVNAQIAKHAPPERPAVPADEAALDADSPARADDAGGEDARPDVPAQADEPADPTRVPEGDEPADVQ